MFSRWIEPGVTERLAAPYVQMMFGARQTGKSTLLQKLIQQAAVWLDFSEPRQRSEYLRDPGKLVDRCRGLPVSNEPHVVVVDEAPAVPEIFNAVQHLYALTTNPQMAPMAAGFSPVVNRPRVRAPCAILPVLSRFFSQL